MAYKKFVFVVQGIAAPVEASPAVQAVVWGGLMLRDEWEVNHAMGLEEVMCVQKVCTLLTLQVLYKYAWCLTGLIISGKQLKDLYCSSLGDRRIALHTDLLSKLVYIHIGEEHITPPRSRLVSSTIDENEEILQACN